MKKILSIFIAVLVLLSCFSFNTFAWEEIGPYDEAALDPNSVITFSEDYKKLYVDDIPYSRFYSSTISITTYQGIDNETEFSNSQSDVDDTYILSSENGEMLEVELYFKDGFSLSATYLRDDYIKEFNHLTESDTEKLYIVFQLADESWDREEIVVEADLNLLKGEPCEITPSFMGSEPFYVSAKSDKFEMYVDKGTLFYTGDEYCYVDYAEFGIDPEEFDTYDYEGAAYKVQDPALLQQIEEARAKYYEDDYGIFFDDDFTEIVAKVFITLLFAVIPFAILVLTLILGIKAKGIYKKLYFTTCILAAAELITLGIVLLIG
ncbi:MAG: hypothetical protein IKJ50_00340 [Clostridia bacterium]|nr:hypothetical protein [Clostridia bacterium]